jgi:hypothetical protein
MFSGSFSFKVSHIARTPSELHVYYTCVIICFQTIVGLLSACVMLTVRLCVISNVIEFQLQKVSGFSELQNMSESLSESESYTRCRQFPRALVCFIWIQECARLFQPVSNSFRHSPDQKCVF